MHIYIRHSKQKCYKTRKGFLRKNIVVVLFSELVYIHPHLLNTKHLHYQKSMKHHNI